MNPFIKEIDELLKQDKERQVIEQINKSSYINNIDILKRLGNAYVRIADYGNAMQTFQTFFQLPHEKEDAAFVWLNIATIMRFQGHPKKGITIMQRLLQDYPENPVYWAELANCYYMADNEEAEQAYKIARKHINNTCEFNKASIYSDIGFYYKEKGDIYASVFYLELALFFSPTDRTILLYLGDAYSEANKNKKAKEAYLKAKTYYPEDPYIQDYVRMQMEFLDE